MPHNSTRKERAPQNSTGSKRVQPAVGLGHERTSLLCFVHGHQIINIRWVCFFFFFFFGRASAFFFFSFTCRPTCRHSQCVARFRSCWCSTNTICMHSHKPKPLNQNALQMNKLTQSKKNNGQHRTDFCKASVRAKKRKRTCRPSTL
jgi:hypothetical protein